MDPILVVSLGRAGSTMLMSYLSTSEFISTDKRYPYEALVANHVCQIYNVLVRDYDNKIPKYGGPNDVVGPFPDNHGKMKEFQTALGNVHNEVLPNLLEEYATSIYKELANIHGCQRGVYFAEKFGVHLIKSARIIFQNAKFVCLVRDFRDQLASMIKFGNVPSGASPSHNHESLSAYISGRMKQQLGGLVRLSRSSDCIIVRYEDLVNDYVGELDRISHFLGVPNMDLEKLPSLPNRHMTSPNPKASVGRYSKDLDENLLKKCNEVLREELKIFGYL